MKKNIAVSELAAYAVNPEGFCKRKGKAENKKAAKYGTRAHNRLGKNSTTQGVVIVVALVVLFTLWSLIK